MVEISAVTGTYNRLKHLQRMVESLRKSVGKVSYEIILVDGGSTDGTLNWCRQQSDVVLIEQGKLLGAIKAFNAGCARASGKYVAILNDDILVNSKTLQIAYSHLEANPHVGQVAFHNIVKGRDPRRTSLGKAYGYVYGQCCMTRRWLGDLVGWWGNDGMHTYGGDTYLSMALWELGWPTEPVRACSITDYVVEDKLRKDRRQMLNKGGHNQDTRTFHAKWHGRLPKPEGWIKAPVNRVLRKVASGELRTLRFKLALPNYAPRTSLSEALGVYGTSMQVNQSAIIRQDGSAKFQISVMKHVKTFQPDLVLFQAQGGGGSVQSGTIWKLREMYPETVFLNFDGDYRTNIRPFSIAVASVVHLQLISSTDLFIQYHNAGVFNVAWWSNGFEWVYGKAKRGLDSSSPDVVFLANVYPDSAFPEAAMRVKAAKALKDADIKVQLYGNGWSGYGLEASYTGDDHELNASIYSRAKMALSISATKDAWGYTSDRLYMIGATGCPIVVQAFAGMDALGYVDGENCIAWSTVNELVDKVKYFLKQADERERIAAAGRQITITKHSYEARVRSLFALLGGLDGLG